ncbi:MAG: c-type cytochrome [Acidobacteria bacterium]|nr:c-type cytochrome [Acidobacteriota bacterium]
MSRLPTRLLAPAIAGALALAAFSLSAAPAPAGTPYKMTIPKGLDEMPVPDDNPMTVEKIDLGRQLYFDTRLSVDSSVSCATCHDPSKGWTDNLPVSKGIKGQKGGRSAPTVINSGYAYAQFWDGRAKSLEEQALGPIQNPIEMGEKLDNVVKKLNGIAGYRSQFQKVYGTDATPQAIAKSIAAFERTIVSGNSPFDRFQAGDKMAMPAAAVRGFEIFKGKAQCTNCHVGFTQSDSLFHNLGVGVNAANPDLGRSAVTKDPKDKGAFKTPTLRDLTKTAPYLHDGSEATLQGVIEFYDKGGIRNPNLDPKMKPLNLTDNEKLDLLAYLKALDGEAPVVTPPKLP